MFINSQFLYLWSAQTLSQFATNVLVFFISFFVYKKTTSNTAVSLALLAFLIPSVLSSVLAGVFVERMGKKWVLILANVTRALIVFMMFFLEKNISFLYILIGLLALTTQFFTPAESSIIPRIVPQQKLLTANAYFSITTNLTLILGFLLSPLFFKLFGYNTVFMIFILYVFSASVLYFLKLEEPVFYTNFRQPLTQLASKFNHHMRHVFIGFFTNKGINRNVFSIIIVQVVLFILVSLAPGFADKILRIPVEDLSFLIVFPTAIGFLCASVVVSRLKNVNERKLLFQAFLSLSIIFFLIFLISQSNVRSIFNVINFLLLVLFGFFSGIVAILGYSNMQKDHGGQGKAGYFGVLNAFINLASVLPVLLSGFLSDFFGIDKIMLMVAIGFACVAYSFKRHTPISPV